MKEVVTAIYPFPWAISDPDQRLILSEEGTEHPFEFLGTPVILAPSTTQPILAGKFVPLPKLGPPMDDKEQLFEVPHGFLAQTFSPIVELIVRGDGHSQRLSFTCRGAIPAPPKNHDERDNSSPENESANLWGLVLSWIDIINEILGLPDAESNDVKYAPRLWSDIAEILLKEKKRQSEARMALIVKIAEEMSREVADIAQRPRRILLRTRQLHRMERIQEVDGTCLRWLIRQPGRTIPEKAGAKQELLAVVREETYDTLENRVLKDFLRRCKYVAMDYLNDQRKFYKSERYKTVEIYKESCRSLLEDSPITDVQPITRAIQPNYVLQIDPRYRKIWHWYQRLLRQEQELDEAWTWQSRLWADISRLLVCVALTGSYSNSALPIKPLAEASARFRTEQLCGSWLIPSSLPGPCHFEYDGMLLILELIDSFHDKKHEHELCRHLGQLGGHFYALITDIHGHRQLLIVFWAIHGASARNLLTPKGIAQSAAESLYYNYLQLRREYSGVPAMAGCVLLSTLEDIERPESPLHEEGKIKVQTIRLPARPERWHDALEYLQIFLVEALDLIKRGST